MWVLIQSEGDEYYERTISDYLQVAGGKIYRTRTFKTSGQQSAATAVAQTFVPD